MFNMDGLEVVCCLKVMGLNYQLLIFIVIVYGWEELFVKVKSFGIDDVLVKFISFFVLFDSLVRVLGDFMVLVQEM